MASMATTTLQLLVEAVAFAIMALYYLVTTVWPIVLIVAIALHLPDDRR